MPGTESPTPRLGIASLLLREGAHLHPVLDLGPLALSPSLQARQLALELAVALEALTRELPRADGLPNRAPRLRVGSAVAEPARARQLLDLSERLGHAVRALPQLQLTQPGLIEHEPAARKHD